MIELVVIAGWLGIGACGAFIGNRRMRQLGYPSCDHCGVITTFAGPIGLAGVCLWITALGE